MNVQVKGHLGVSDGFGFAIPSRSVKSIAGQLISSGKAEHAFLGVVLQDSSSSGGRISGVRAGTPAAKAGLRGGDVITAIAGKSVASANALRAAINAHQPGDHVSITYTRNTTSHTVGVTLTSRPS